MTAPLVYGRIASALGLLLLTVPLPAFCQDRVDYRVLSTTKTSAMQKEMQEAAEAGYRFGDVMGGSTAFRRF